MPLDTVDELVEALNALPLLDAAQRAALHELRPQYAKPLALANHLFKRGWLTEFQVNQLFKGRGPALVVGNHVLLEKLGSGGMGQVYKARHQKLGRVVAIKIIRPQQLANPVAVQRFRREILAVAQLSHPNIVLAYDADQVGDVHFFVMEYVEGEDLGSLSTRRGPLPVEEACDYAWQAALGLQHAHERGLIHRDIKPTNILVASKGGVVKVLDLGLARATEALGSQDLHLTRQGVVMGTPDYIAPEQTEDAHAVDARADLYSLGGTMYFLLTGRVPFPDGTLLEKLFQHRNTAPRPPRQLRPELPPAVCAVVERLLAKHPGERYQTAADLADALQPFVNPGRVRLLHVVPSSGLRTPVPPHVERQRAPNARASEAVPSTVEIALADPAAEEPVELELASDTAAEWKALLTPPSWEGAPPYPVLRRPDDTSPVQRILLVGLGLLVGAALAGLFFLR